ncbi:hypothetical protein C8Q79DRAFT_462809 [Trametes meyenii]|nr:hypothetical protein C8Q79DRAFT_462809 [Trametes meyenii]
MTGFGRSSHGCSIPYVGANVSMKPSPRTSILSTWASVCAYDTRWRRSRSCLVAVARVLRDRYARRIRRASSSAQRGGGSDDVVDRGAPVPCLRRQGRGAAFAVRTLSVPREHAGCGRGLAGSVPARAPHRFSPFSPLRSGGKVGSIRTRGGLGAGHHRHGARGAFPDKGRRPPRDVYVPPTASRLPRPRPRTDTATGRREATGVPWLPLHALHGHTGMERARRSGFDRGFRGAFGVGVRWCWEVLGP